MKLTKESVLSQYGVIIVATMVMNGINYFYALIEGRLLGPDVYSAYVSLVGISIALTVAAGTFGTIIARYVSEDKGRGDEANAKYFSFRALSVLILLGIAGLAVVLALSSPINSWLKIGAILPCVLLAFRTGLCFVQPVATGTLMGLQRFNELAAVLIAGSVVRFIVGVGLVLLGLGVSGAMWGEVAGVVAIIAIPLLMLRKWYSGRPREGRIDFSHLRRFAPAALVATACVAVFIVVDVILARALIGGESAGFYAGAQKMASMIFILPGAVAIVMFPKVSEKSARNDKSWRILGQSIAIVTGLCGSVALIFAIFPRQLLGLFFGSKYLEGSHVVPVLSLAMFLLSLVSIMTYYLLGTEHFNFAYVLAPGIVFEIAGIVLFHGSIAQIAWVVTFTGAALVVIIGGYLFRKWRLDMACGKVRVDEQSECSTYSTAYSDNTGNACILESGCALSRKGRTGKPRDQGIPGWLPTSSCLNTRTRSYSYYHGGCGGV